MKEYEAFYRQNPERWTADDDAICRTVSRYKPAPERMLDVGCGNGHTLAKMRDVFPKAWLYGVDLSQEALHMASDKVPSGVFKQGFVEQYNPGVFFDVITVVGVAEHFIDLYEGLMRVAGLLTKDGICYLELPNNLAYSPGAHIYRRLECGSGQMEWHLGREEWEQLIGKAGFEILEARSGNSLVNEFVWVCGSASHAWHTNTTLDMPMRSCGKDMPV